MNMSLSEMTRRGMVMLKVWPWQSWRRENIKENVQVMEQSETRGSGRSVIRSHNSLEDLQNILYNIMYNVYSFHHRWLTWSESGLVSWVGSIHTHFTSDLADGKFLKVPRGQCVAVSTKPKLVQLSRGTLRWWWTASFNHLQQRDIDGMRIRAREKDRKSNKLNYKFAHYNLFYICSLKAL